MNTSPWIQSELINLLNKSDTLNETQKKRRAVVISIDSDSKGVILTDGIHSITAFLESNDSLFQHLLSLYNSTSESIEIELNKYFFAITTSIERQDIKEPSKYPVIILFDFSIIQKKDEISILYNKNKIISICSSIDIQKLQAIPLGIIKSTKMSNSDLELYNNYIKNIENSACSVVQNSIPQILSNIHLQRDTEMNGSMSDDSLFSSDDEDYNNQSSFNKSNSIPETSNNQQVSHISDPIMKDNNSSMSLNSSQKTSDHDIPNSNDKIEIAEKQYLDSISNNINQRESMNTMNVSKESLSSVIPLASLSISISDKQSKDALESPIAQNLYSGINTDDRQTNDIEMYPRDSILLSSTQSDTQYFTQTLENNNDINDELDSKPSRKIILRPSLYSNMPLSSIPEVNEDLASLDDVPKTVDPIPRTTIDYKKIFNLSSDEILTDTNDQSMKTPINNSNEQKDQLNNSKLSDDDSELYYDDSDIQQYNGLNVIIERDKKREKRLSQKRFRIEDYDENGNEIDKQKIADEQKNARISLDSYSSLEQENNPNYISRRLSFRSSRSLPPSQKSSEEEKKNSQSDSKLHDLSMSSDRNDSESELNQSIEEISEVIPHTTKRRRYSDGTRPIKVQKHTTSQPKRRHSKKFLAKYEDGILFDSLIIFLDANYIWGYKWKDYKPKASSHYMYMDLIKEWNKSNAKK